MSLTLLQKYSPYHHWEYMDLETGDCLRIVPERGGLITSWICNRREILYFDEARFLDSSKSIRGGIPILFPICGNLTADKFTFKNKEYYIKQHGFARDSSWQLKPLDDKSGVTLTLRANKTTLLSFPFQFHLEIQIRLQKSSLEISPIITNHGDTLMPFSFGLHPYFLVKDLRNVEIIGLPDDCTNYKTMNNDETNILLKELPQGVDFLSSHLNSTFLLDHFEKTQLELRMDPPFDFNVIWTDPPRQMLCLEPWTSPRNSLLTGERIINLSPGEIKNLKCQFIFNRMS